VASFFRKFPLSKNLVGELRHEHPDLTYLQGFYESLAKARGFGTAALAEGRPFRIGPLRTVKIVEVASAAPWPGHPPTEVDMDHCEITSPRDRADQVYKSVVYHINKWLTSAPIPPRTPTIGELVQSYLETYLPKDEWVPLPVAAYGFSSQDRFFGERFLGLLALACFQEFGSDAVREIVVILSSWEAEVSDDPNMPIARFWNVWIPHPGLCARFRAEYTGTLRASLRIPSPADAKFEDAISQLTAEAARRIKQVEDFDFSAEIPAESLMQPMRLHYDGPAKTLGFHPVRDESPASDSPAGEPGTSSLLEMVATARVNGEMVLTSQSPDVIEIANAFLSVGKVELWLIEILVADPERFRLAPYWQEVADWERSATESEELEERADPPLADL
jgi:hypothetical protein